MAYEMAKKKQYTSLDVFAKAGSPCTETSQVAELKEGQDLDVTCPIEVVDLFCGIGGLSYGLKTAGFLIKGGFDIDSSCRFAYEHNNDTLFFDTDICKVTKSEINSLYSKDAIKLLAGCAPCQPFSSYSHTKKDKDKK